MKTIILLLVVLVYTSNTLKSATLAQFLTPTGSTEHLVAKFDHSIEATTVNAYTGYLHLHFSGYGGNNPSERFDAFWFFENANQTNWIPTKQGLGIAFDNTFVIGSNTTYYEKDIGNNTNTIDISQSLWQIVWNSDVGNYSGLNRGGFPQYNENHEYDIVLYVNSLNSRILNFGFLDGGLSDNFGQVDISLTPITPIPEPSVIGLLLLSSVFFVRKR